MSGEIGYNGRELVILKASVPIAAVTTKSAAHNREGVDVTTDDSAGNRTLLPDPGMRAMDMSVEGVVTVDNGQDFLEEWNGTVNSDVGVRYPDGTVATAAHGFFLGNLEFKGEYNGRVSFTAQLLSSGAVTFAPGS
jgi:predicted secreted protein